MAFPVGAAIAAGASLAGSAASIAATGKLNRRNREWQEKMYAETNAYNHPMNQMQRFREAGLNPHLIYGQGNSGNATMASAPNQEVPNFNFVDAVNAYVTTRKQQVETDNLEKAQKVMDSQIASNNASAQNALSNSARTDQERMQAAETFSMVKKQLELNLDMIGTQIDKATKEIDNIIADTALKMQNTRESGERIKNLEIQGEKLKAEISQISSNIKMMIIDGDYKKVQTELGKADLRLREMGIYQSDPSYMRIIGPMLKESGILDDVNSLLRTRFPLPQQFMREKGWTLKNLFK